MFFHHCSVINSHAYFPLRLYSRRGFIINFKTQIDMAMNYKVSEKVDTYKKMITSIDDYIVVCNMLKLERIHKLRNKMYRSGEEFNNFNEALRVALDFIVNSLLADELSETIYTTLVNTYNTEPEVLSACFDEFYAFTTDYHRCIHHAPKNAIWDAVRDILHSLEVVYTYTYE